MSHRLADLAREIDAELKGDGERRIDRVRSLEEAGSEDLAPFFRSGYRPFLETTEAALLVSPDLAGLPEMAGRDLLVAANASLALARLLALLNPVPRPAAGIHPTAVVGAECRVDPAASIGPYCVLGERVEIGPDTVLHPHVTVGDDCRIGAGTVLHPQVVLYSGTVLGLACEVHSGTVLGADGFGYAGGAGLPTKVPQVGTVALGDQVEVGANSAIDRGTLGETRIGDGTKVDNLVQVGHNCRTGRGCILCGQVALGGSTVLGDGVVLGGRAGVADHLEIGSGVNVAATSLVTRKTPVGPVAGNPARPIKEWRREVAGLRKLGDLRRRLRTMEQAVEALRAQVGEAGEE